MQGVVTDPNTMQQTIATSKAGDVTNISTTVDPFLGQGGNGTDSHARQNSADSGLGKSFMVDIIELDIRNLYDLIRNINLPNQNAVQYKLYGVHGLFCCLQNMVWCTFTDLADFCME